MFPMFVFYSPGPLDTNGGTYAQYLVEDEEQLKEALRLGYYRTVTEALDNSGKELPPVEFEEPKKKAKK